MRKQVFQRSTAQPIPAHPLFFNTQEHVLYRRAEEALQLLLQVFVRYQHSSSRLLKTKGRAPLQQLAQPLDLAGRRLPWAAVVLARRQPE